MSERLREPKPAWTAPSAACERPRRPPAPPAHSRGKAATKRAASTDLPKSPARRRATVRRGPDRRRRCLCRRGVRARRVVGPRRLFALGSAHLDTQGRRLCGPRLGHAARGARPTRSAYQFRTGFQGRWRTACAGAPTPAEGSARCVPERRVSRWRPSAARRKPRSPHRPAHSAGAD